MRAAIDEGAQGRSFVEVEVDGRRVGKEAG
jgi:hypothetical protein